jgi:phospholipase D3/4
VNSKTQPTVLHAHALIPPFTPHARSNADIDYCLNDLGGQKGEDLYNEMFTTLERGVSLRFIQAGTGTDDVPPQLQALLDAYPDLVDVHYWNAADWYSGGIMHQKIWIADSTTFYIGSSNMDWLSLSQVKELGVTVKDSIGFGSDIQSYFDNWWEFAGADAEGYKTEHFSKLFQTNLEVPCWSQQVNQADRCELPSALLRTVGTGSEEKPFPPSIDHPATQPRALNGTLTNTTIITGSPPEILGNTFEEEESLRTWDLDGLIYTIEDAKEYVYLQVMDYIPSSAYSSDIPDGSTAYWPALNAALLAVTYSKDVNVRLLISYWEHSDTRIYPQLQSLVTQSKFCANVDGSMPASGCSGGLEVKIFQVPGFNQTIDAKQSTLVNPEAFDPIYPDHSRVSHSKFITTDRRTNIGTSNMAFSYFYQVAGASFNTDNSQVVAAAGEIFLRDWDSAYAIPIDTFIDQLP